MQWAVFGLTFLVAVVLISIGIWLSGFLASLLSRLRGSLAHGIDALQRVSENLTSTSSAIVTNQERQISSITESSESSNSISRTAGEAAGHVREVKGQIQHLDSMLGDAETAVKSLNDHMQQIEGSNRRVADIIQVLDSIAFQTNILALNASIEAARAGAVGSGFAVVADEVRSLAQRAGEASGQIRDQVQESLARAEEGTSRLGKVMHLFQASREASLGVAKNAQLLEAEASSQAAGVLEVSRIMDRISQITTSSAQAAREGSSMAGELQEEVQELDAVFNEVLELVGASDASMPSR
jgi:methyl-accepting chemotaxis protein